jgi:hypothetical protein
MKAHIKKSLVVAVVFLAMLAGLLLARSSHKPAPSALAANPSGSLVSTGSGMPDMSKLTGDQMRVYSSIMQYRLEPHLAAFISQTKMELISRGDVPIHYLLTFPNGVTSDETITIAPNQKFTPTAAELERSKKSGIQIFSPKLSVKKTGPQEAVFTLDYYVLQSSLPPEFQSFLQKSSSNSGPPGWDPFALIPSAYAQEGSDSGSGYVANEGAEFTKTEVVKGLEIAELEKSAHVADNVLTMKDLVMGYQEMTEWLAEVDELRDCAEHPTNPLAQKASETPEYQQQVIDSLGDTRSSVKWAAVPKIANITAGALTQFMDELFGAGLLVAPITTANDEAISEIVHGEIEDARKGVTPCHHEQVTEGTFRPMQGNLTYIYVFNSPEECRHEQCVHSENEAHFEGTIHMAPDQTFGYLSGKGTGRFTRKRDQGAHDQYCKSESTHEETTGPGEIEVQAGGDSPLNGVVKARWNSSQLKMEGTQTGCNGSQTSTHGENAYSGADCEFHNVDLVHGGTYSAFETADNHGTCKLEIFPE